MKCCSRTERWRASNSLLVLTDWDSTSIKARQENNFTLWLFWLRGDEPVEQEIRTFVWVTLNNRIQTSGQRVILYHTDRLCLCRLQWLAVLHVVLQHSSSRSEHKNHMKSESKGIIYNTTLHLSKQTYILQILKPRANERSTVNQSSDSEFTLTQNLLFSAAAKEQTTTKNT